MSRPLETHPNSLASEEGIFQNSDGLKLHYEYFPRMAAKDTLLILHGHGEHSGRYRKFASILEADSLNIAVFDYRGQGRSEGDEVFIHQFEDLTRDVSSFVDFLKTRYGLHEKFFILGHSLGGLVGVHWALQNPSKLKALILSSPFLGIQLPKYLVQMNHFLSRYMPKMIYSNPVYPPHLTHNLEEVANYSKDKLIKRKITARLLDEALLAMEKLEKMTPIRFPFPFYVLVADMEKIVNGNTTKVFYERVQAPAKELIAFSGFYHEIFNELGQEKAFEALKRCIYKSR